MQRDALFKEIDNALLYMRLSLMRTTDITKVK